MLEKFYQARILVVGDVMLDRYLYGKVERISPEAPVPVVLISGESYTPGGAANVANNVASLKAHCILIGMKGNDESGSKLTQLLDDKNVGCELLEWEYPTITKTRIVSSHQQLIRLDFESSFGISWELQQKIIERVEVNVKNVNVVVISDYGKGICTRDVCRNIINLAKRHSIPVIIDPKKTDWDRYYGATLITPNLKELSDYYGRRLENEDKVVEECVKNIYDNLGVENILVTRSEKGMTLFDGRDFYHFPTEAREVYDVSGAGDTVVATLSVAYSSGFNLKDAVLLANKAAGIVVGKAGTAPIYYEELVREFEKQTLTKLVGINELLIILEDLRKKGKKVVFTNGCFDIIHRGHVSYLNEARKLGDVLIVGLNSDESVRRLKGNSRPINSVEDRAVVLSALECVDYVVVFEEDTPFNLLSRIRPDILVKGGDYREEEVIGREFASKTVILPFVEGYSTTSIIKRLSSG